MIDVHTYCMNELLIEYVRLMLAEDKDARVPDQLIDPEDVDGRTNEDEEDVEELDEFSGCGGITGYTGPLGISGDALGRRKNKGKK